MMSWWDRGHKTIFRPIFSRFLVFLNLVQKIDIKKYLLSWHHLVNFILFLLISSRRRSFPSTWSHARSVIKKQIFGSRPGTSLIMLYIIHASSCSFFPSMTRSHIVTVGHNNPLRCSCSDPIHRMWCRLLYCWQGTRPVAYSLTHAVVRFSICLDSTLEE